MTVTALAYEEPEERPSVGSIVLYTGTTTNTTMTAPALVTDANGSNVDLTVFWPGQVGFASKVPPGEGNHTWRFGH